MAEETVEFLKDALKDMKESAKEQHEKDKKNFEKIKAESKARHEAAIAKGKELGKIRK